MLVKKASECCFMLKYAAVFSYKALKTVHCAPSAQHRTADSHNDGLAAKNRETFGGKKVSVSPQIKVKESESWSTTHEWHCCSVTSAAIHWIVTYQFKMRWSVAVLHRTLIHTDVLDQRKWCLIFHSTSFSIHCEHHYVYYISFIQLNAIKLH